MFTHMKLQYILQWDSALNIILKSILIPFTNSKWCTALNIWETRLPHNSNHEQYYLLGSDTVQSGRRWSIVPSPHSGSEYQSMMSKEATSTVLFFLFNHINGGSEFLQKSTNSYQVHIPEDSTIYSIIQFLLKRMHCLCLLTQHYFKITSHYPRLDYTCKQYFMKHQQMFNCLQQRSKWLNHINFCKRQFSPQA
jgi:hypothetical protein